MNQATSFRVLRPIALAGLSLCAGSAAQADLIRVRYESERPGMQTSSATFSLFGQESFNSRPTGIQDLLTDFGSDSALVGEYRNLEIRNADQYGGADGRGRYAVTFRSTGYELKLGTADGRGLNYFGFWLSALDANNYLSFYRGDELLLAFNPADMLAMVAGDARYFGNPNGPFAGRNSREPYAFLNFFNESGTFDRVVFRQAAGGGYESDNHTVGRWLSQGTGRELGVYGVPEPSSLALIGAAVLAFAARRAVRPAIQRLARARRA